MTQRQILLIKSSWSFAVMHSQEAGELFYQKLFELDPMLKNLFPSNMEDQVKKFMQMLTYLIVHLQDTHDLDKQLSSLAARHATYGVQQKHLMLTCQALLTTIAQINGNRWNKETAHSWRNFFHLFTHSFSTKPIQHA